MRTYYCFITILMFIFPLFTISQNNYFVYGTVTTTGATIIDGKEASLHKVCRIREGAVVLEYTPWQVKEYGFKDGCVYIAKDIPLPDSTTRVFLEVIETGKHKVYYYRGKQGKTFFLEQDSAAFIELPKTRKGNDSADFNFRNDLARLTSDCPQMADAIKLVRYNRNGYKKLLTRYETCRRKPFPFFKFGVTFGYSAAKAIPKNGNSMPEIQELDYSYDGGLVAGLFFDSPIFLSDFSLVASALYVQHELSGHGRYLKYKDVNFYGKMSSVQIPVLARYSLPSNRIRPFVNVGGVVSFNFNTEDFLCEANILHHVIEIVRANETSMIKTTMLGFTVGAGAAVQLRPRNWVFLEMRYNGYYALNSAEAMNISDIQVTASISF